jgi:hypothetical protein
LINTGVKTDGANCDIAAPRMITNGTEEKPGGEAGQSQDMDRFLGEMSDDIYFSGGLVWMVVL